MKRSNSFSDSTKQVGDYALGKTLGAGNYGKVKEGCNTKTGEKVAVKIIDKEKLAHEHLLDKVRRILWTRAIFRSDS